MSYAASLAELQRSGPAFSAEEAVAVIQKLIQQSIDAPQPPFGPPAMNNTRVTVDGAVECRACEVTPAVVEVAILLQAMLASTPHVPGGLRYAIARALHEVDAPPFDSIEEFSATIARYEPADCDEAIRRIAARGDRRRPIRATTDLRRQLREADRRLYETRTPVDSRQLDRPQPRTRGWMVAAVVAGALTTIAAAGLIGDRPPALPRMPAAPEASAIAPVKPVAADVEPIHVAPAAHRPHARPRRPVRVVRVARESGSAHRTIRLRWLNKTIAFRDDLTKP